jgi:hypothetical protein
MKNNILVCGPKDNPDGLKLSVSSRAPIVNPNEFKDLWLLSPFSIIPGGIEVPGLPGVKSKTVENAWQFLKVWEDEQAWNKVEAMAAFESDCAIRYPRGKKPVVTGHYWGEGDSILNYITARKKIYFRLYLEMLMLPDRKEVLERINNEANNKKIYVWDFDSYDYKREGLKSIFETILYTNKPFAHAFILAIYLNNQIDDFKSYIMDN